VIAYPGILDVRAGDVPTPWSDRDAILYALSIGAAADPLDRGELSLVWEQGLQVIPTFCTVISSARLVIPRLDLNQQRILAGGQSVTMHRPMPATSATAVSDARVRAVYDKGADKGAVVEIENVLKDRAGGTPIATLVTTLFARGDGGCGAPNAGQPPVHRVPDRLPDARIELPTTIGQALLYRLNGDRHPLHIDPDFAVRAGFARPIMHGLCTFGITCRGVMLAFAGNDPIRIVSHEARFSGSIYPGETIAMRLWRDDDVISFEATVKERGTPVISGGRARLG